MLLSLVPGYLFENDSRVVPEKFEGESSPLSTLTLQLSRRNFPWCSWGATLNETEWLSPRASASSNLAELLVFPHVCATYLVTRKQLGTPIRVS